MVASGTPARSTRLDPLDIGAPGNRPTNGSGAKQGNGSGISTREYRSPTPTGVDDPAVNDHDRALLASHAVLSQAPSENFPVASRILPAAIRRHLFAVYGFARLVDDIGDEATGDRVALLDWLDAELERASRGQAEHPLLVTVGASIADLDLPLQPFRDLIEANRRDQVVRRYETFDDLLDYCMLSAAPVGRLVLLVLGQSNPWRVRLSDDVCVGLQVVEHIQDVAEDLAQDRVYLPLDDLERVGCAVEDLSTSSASPEVKRAIALECGRASRLLRSGVSLAASLPLRHRLAVAGFVAGGTAALDSVEKVDFDVLAHRCPPRPARFAVRLVHTVASTLRFAEPSPVGVGVR
jgi:squalene synthase HpnC